MSILTTMRVDVYYLLHVCCVYSEVRIKFYALECLLYLIV